MTNAEVEQLKAQMNMENVDMSGAQAESQEDQAARLKRELPLSAQAYPKIELNHPEIYLVDPTPQYLFWLARMFGKKSVAFDSECGYSTFYHWRGCVYLWSEGWPKKKWWQWWRK